MISIKKIIPALTLLFISGEIFSQELSGYDIAKKNHGIAEAKTASYSITMTLTDKNGKNRVREMLMRSKDYGETEKSVFIFVTPKDVAGVGYLSFEYEEKADGTKPKSDNWLYMPALKKSRRISGSDTNGSFMGSDFTYDDMGDRGLNEDEYELLGEENVNGEACYKINAISKDKSIKNPRRVLYINKENFMLYKCELFDRQNSLQRVLTCSDIKSINGYLTCSFMKIENVQTNHSTSLEMKNIVFDTKLDDNMFTVSALERGIIK